MKFSRLRLLGFKSFVEPGEFVIERGLTGIVGPNGCGKSNLVEALRWVMGESSYKNMRASGMDDVIFSGSGTRPARNTAEVTLFLDNSDRTAPAAFNDADELQVSRRIEREAGSLYRINGKEARAKDVQLLFADQSTGARSPSMVGQGRIGELIQAKPQARRALLEEAAGISGLHTRRHEAELRLKAAEQNLERLDDVVGELESQIESLKRQARQASRFKNLSADIRKAEATLLHLRWTLAKTQEGEARSALAVATALVGDRAAAQMAAAREQGDRRAPAAGSARRGSRRRCRLPAPVDRQGADRGGGRPHPRPPGRTRPPAAAARRRHRPRGADGARQCRHSRTPARRKKPTLNSENAGAAEREATTRAAFEQAGATLVASEAKLAALTAERAEAAASRNQIERTLRETAERRDRFARQLADVDRELSEIISRVAGLPDPAEKRASGRGRAWRRWRKAEAGAIAAEQAVAEARAAESAARPPLQDARAELAGIETEARTLAKILNAASGDLFPSVLEQISVERGYETALGAALGEDLDVPLDRSAPVHWGESEVQPAMPALPEGIRSLASVVRAPAQLARRLAQIGIVDAADGRRLQALLAPGQRLVSREGALWRWDGLTASADAPTAAAQRLAQKNRLAELDAEAVQATQIVREAEAALAQAEQALRQASEAERNARQAGRDAQHGLDAARNALAEAEKAGGELASRRAALDEARARIVDSHEETAAAFAEAEMLLQDAPDLGDLQLQLEQSAANVGRDRATLADARAVHEGLRREAEARTRRLDAIGAERSNWLQRAENASTQIASLGERRAEAEAERETLADAPDEIDARRRALLSQLAEAETLAQGGGRPLAGGREPAGRTGQGRHRGDPVAGRCRAKPASAPRSG